EIDHFLLADYLSRHVTGATQRIDQPKLQRLFAGPDQPGEQLGMLVCLETITTPLLHTVDELTMSGIEHGFPEAGFLFLLRLERIEECLVLTRGVDATLDPQLLHGLDETEAGRSDSDGTDQTGLVGIYFIGRTGNVVGTGSTQITDHRVDLGLRMLAAQATTLG